jgi:hypothetical protein
MSRHRKQIADGGGRSAEPQMNAPFNAVSAAQCFIAAIPATAPSPRFERPTRRQTTMLVLYVALAILGSFLVEMVLHQFRKNYEIVWVSAPEKSGRDIAEEIVRNLRARKLGI